jgi:hypothetical protein
MTSATTQPAVAQLGDLRLDLPGGLAGVTAGGWFVVRAVR